MPNRIEKPARDPKQNALLSSLPAATLKSLADQLAAFIESTESAMRQANEADSKSKVEPPKVSQHAAPIEPPRQTPGLLFAREQIKFDGEGSLPVMLPLLQNGPPPTMTAANLAMSNFKLRAAILTDIRPFTDIQDHRKFLSRSSLSSGISKEEILELDRWTAKLVHLSKQRSPRHRRQWGRANREVELVKGLEKTIMDLQIRVAERIVPKWSLVLLAVLAEYPPDLLEALGSVADLYKDCPSRQEGDTYEPSREGPSTLPQWLKAPLGRFQVVRNCEFPETPGRSELKCKAIDLPNIVFANLAVLQRFDDEDPLNSKLAKAAHRCRLESLPNHFFSLYEGRQPELVEACYPEWVNRRVKCCEDLMPNQIAWWFDEKTGALSLATLVVRETEVQVPPGRGKRRYKAKQGLLRYYPCDDIEGWRNEKRKQIERVDEEARRARGQPL
ncbi:hypothetical protein H2200_010704 [Cladophialophora chaetospira]|uniref:Uncharacterized protein n=1 Tax=Cladophialophora chaetospira TaxID=386627 RepID=A0AA38X0L4_9EURO|nr:hypothetical protein H2200_010704 [Cladophialophora chaetospira]